MYRDQHENKAYRNFERMRGRKPERHKERLAIRPHIRRDVS